MYRKHGLRYHKLYYVWQSMHRRCTVKHRINYKHYGGRGIKVCKEWEDVVIFYNWCMANGYKEGLEIDRINNNGNYEPRNCRFTTSSENSINRRVQSNNKTEYIGITYNKIKKRYRARIGYRNKLYTLGRYKMIEDAIIARNNWVTANKTSHKIQSCPHEYPDSRTD